MLKNKADAVEQLNNSTNDVVAVREKSAIQYSAGICGCQAAEKYEQPLTHPQVQLKCILLFMY